MALTISQHFLCKLILSSLFPNFTNWVSRTGVNYESTILTAKVQPITIFIYQMKFYYKLDYHLSCAENSVLETATLSTYLTENSALLAGLAASVIFSIHSNKRRSEVSQMKSFM